MITFPHQKIIIGFLDCLTMCMCELLCSSSPSMVVPMLLTCFMLEFSATPVINLAPWFIGLEQTSNCAFPSYLVPLFHSETFQGFNLHVNKQIHFHIILMVLHTDFWHRKRQLGKLPINPKVNGQFKDCTTALTFFLFQSCYCSSYTYICMHTLLHNMTWNINYKCCLSSHFITILVLDLRKLTQD